MGEHEGAHYIAMEFIDGDTLRDTIDRGHTELPKVLRFLQHTAEGLAKAHAAGIVHRDLKPDNIMITRDGHAKILDFGLVKLVETAGPDAARAGGLSGDDATMMAQQSTPGMILGTAGYMSPEQAQGRVKGIDQRCDIFSFGCMLYEAATGHKAFAGKDLLDSLHKIVHAPTPQINDVRPALPDGLQRIVRRCLAKDPDERYQTIKEVAIELKDLRRELEGSGSDPTRSPGTTRETTGAAESDTSGSPSSTATIRPPASAVSTSRASSEEYVVSRIKPHRLTVGVVVLLLLGGIVALVFSFRPRTAGNTIASIAMLPFENKSTGADTEYLSDGLAESLIYLLSQLRNLKVSPTSSTMRYKGKPMAVEAIAGELGVNAVMTGRIAQRGDHLTISVELVDVPNNRVCGASSMNPRCRSAGDAKRDGCRHHRQSATEAVRRE
ncbi:MAG: serine/threonine-protein kinase [Vicinamibacterales bacterium]